MSGKFVKPTTNFQTSIDLNLTCDQIAHFQTFMVQKYFFFFVFCFLWETNEKREKQDENKNHNKKLDMEEQEYLR